MPIVLNGSTGITANNLGVETIVDSAGTGAPSFPNGFEQMFVLPVGTLMWFTGDTAPGGYLVADGSLHSRAAYPDLWSWIVTSGNIAVSDAVWTFGQYSPGDGATTFRVPKVDDRFIRGKSATRAVGLVEEDEFKSHTHTTDIARTDAGAAGTNAYHVPTHGGTYIGTQPWISNSTGGDETRPKALTMLPCIKAYDAISDPNVLNAVAVVNDMARMMPRDENINLGVSVAASGTAVDFVGIPEGVKRITVMFNGVSITGANHIIVQLGDGALQTTGYSSVRAGITNGPATFIGVVESGFLFGGGGEDLTCRGSIIISKMNNTTWVYSGSARNSGNTLIGEFYGGDVVFSGTLDRLRITTVNGADQFDAGTINISWEF